MRLLTLTKTVRKLIVVIITHLGYSPAHMLEQVETDKRLIADDSDTTATADFRKHPRTPSEVLPTDPYDEEFELEIKIGRGKRIPEDWRGPYLRILAVTLCVVLLYLLFGSEGAQEIVRMVLQLLAGAPGSCTVLYVV